MVICLERGADLHMAQLMPLPLTVSCFSKIQIGFHLSCTGWLTWVVPERKAGPVKRVWWCLYDVFQTHKMMMMMMIVMMIMTLRTTGEDGVGVGHQQVDD